MIAPFLPPTTAPTAAPDPAPIAVVSLSRCSSQKDRSSQRSRYRRVSYRQSLVTLCCWYLLPSFHRLVLVWAPAGIEVTISTSKHTILSNPFFIPSLPPCLTIWQGVCQLSRARLAPVFCSFLELRINKV